MAVVKDPKQPQCVTCWNARNPQDLKSDPINPKRPKPVVQCAWCGSSTRAGIVVRVDQPEVLQYARDKE